MTQDSSEAQFRALLEGGGIEAILAREAPGQHRLSEAERDASLRAALAARPEDVWVFAYGSLIWNPALRIAERRVARVEGWHRAFCLASRFGRGTPEKPGLVLALDEGGHCDGIALRIAAADLEAELPLLWRREMATSGYIPRWVALLDPAGVPFGRALTFTIDRAGAGYAGDLPAEAVVRRLATAAGGLGTAADYLFRTRDGLRECGIPDPALERLAAEVESAMAVA